MLPRRRRGSLIVTDVFRSIVPGLPGGFVDSLREAALNDEFDRAEKLMHVLGGLLAQRRTDRVQLKLMMKTAARLASQAASRRRAEAFLNRLSWPI